jgi:hypothetical protein
MHWCIHIFMLLLLFRLPLCLFPSFSKCQRAPGGTPIRLCILLLLLASLCSQQWQGAPLLLLLLLLQRVGAQSAELHRRGPAAAATTAAAVRGNSKDLGKLLHLGLQLAA